MTIPKLTQEQRIQSFMDERLAWTEKEEVTMTKENLAKFCLQEIDEAVDLINSTDIEDVEEQFED